MIMKEKENNESKHNMITEKLCPQTKQERGEVYIKCRDVCVLFVCFGRGRV